MITFHMGYNPRDWYWQIGDDATRLWSSKTASFVTARSKAYKDWSALGNVATRIASLEELREVLLARYPEGAPNPAA